MTHDTSAMIRRLMRNQAPSSAGREPGRAGGGGGRFRLLPAVMLAGLVGSVPVAAADAPVPGGWLSPAAVVAAPDGKSLFVACATADRVLQVDTAAGKVVRAFEVPAAPSGLALDSGSAKLYATSAATAGQIVEIDLAGGAVRASLSAGHGATGPVLSPDGKTLYVCLRFDGCIAAFDLARRPSRSASRCRASQSPRRSCLTGRRSWWRTTCTRGGPTPTWSPRR